MSLIEQAAKRLEELRRSGADLGDARPVGGGSRQAENRDTPTPEAVIRALDARAAHARAAEAAVAADAIALHAALNGTPRPEAQSRVRGAAVDCSGAPCSRFSARGPFDRDADHSRIARGTARHAHP